MYRNRRPPVTTVCLLKPFYNDQSVDRVSISSSFHNLLSLVNPAPFFKSNRYRRAPPVIPRGLFLRRGSVSRGHSLRGRAVRAQRRAGGRPRDHAEGSAGRQTEGEGAFFVHFVYVIILHMYMCNSECTSTRWGGSLPEDKLQVRELLLLLFMYTLLVLHCKYVTCRRKV
jgi:hypothetical protein